MPQFLFELMRFIWNGADCPCLWLNERSPNRRLIKRSGLKPLLCDVTAPSLMVRVGLQASTMKGTITHTSLTQSSKNCTRWPTSWISHANGLSFLPTPSAFICRLWVFFMLSTKRKKEAKKEKRNYYI